MARTEAVRSDPAALLPGAKTVLALAACNACAGQVAGGPVAPYAQGRDYHSVVKDKLKALRRLLKADGVHASTFATCDTAPVHEKAWAARAGLGWIGKSCLLVTPDHGTRVSLATLILDDEADEYGEPMPSRCGACDRCLRACPTSCLSGDGTLDARRCLAFQTIENRAAALPEDIVPAMAGRVFGCDACQGACPWNRAGHACDDPKFAPRPLARLSVEEWAVISDGDFEALAAGTALKRPGAEGIRRNARAALAAAEMAARDGGKGPKG